MNNSKNPLKSTKNRQKINEQCQQIHENSMKNAKKSIKSTKNPWTISKNPWKFHGKISDLAEGAWSTWTSPGRTCRPRRGLGPEASPSWLRPLFFAGKKHGKIKNLREILWEISREHDGNMWDTLGKSIWKIYWEHNGNMWELFLKSGENIMGTYTNGNM